MPKPLRAVLLILALHAGVGAQEQTPYVLLHAAQCLSAKNFLTPPKTTLLSFAYLLDLKSYPGEKVVYVIRHTRSDRSHGEAFSVFLSESHRRQVFSINNNAIFVRTKSGVEFTGDPLGGIWTQQHLVSAIKQVERKPRFEIPFMNLRPSPSIRCEAYTDNLR